MNDRVARGSIALVGAGPGDPELLTLKAVRAIAGADVLLVDDLVDDRVLEHARADARIVHVGKRGGCISTPQAFIDRLLVSEALAGHRVVRLKGGDPFLFGRGGEELEAARAAGVPIEIVPGVSAAFAAAASEQIPLTHRDHAQGVAFVTGHARADGQGRDPDWAVLARSGLTLVVYMGLARIETIAQALLDGGLASTTPVALVARASLPTQSSLRATLSTMAEVARAAALASPAVLVIGEVARSAAAPVLAREGLERASA